MLDASAPWYPVTTAIPGERVRVRLQWAGRMLIAWRGVEPKTRRRCWVVPTVGGELAFWPPPHDPRLADGPSAWQPEYAGEWEGALPAPFPRPPAAKIPARREEAVELADGASWWRDPSQIRYAPHGEVSLRDCEGRLMRAILTDGLRPEKAQNAPNGWPVSIEEAARLIKAEAADPTRSLGQRFEPTPRDWDDYLAAMGWFAAMNPPEMWHRRREPFSLTLEQRVLVWRAVDPPFTWRQMAEKAGRSAEGARKLYIGGVERAWRAANGLRVFRHLTVADRMAAVRERNREARGRR